MEGLPAGDIQAKYQKLASEYSKLRVHVKVLKKGVLDEQAKSNELRETLKEKEKLLRKGESETDSLTFRNQQLTRRVSVLQDELDLLQLKYSKKTKGKVEEKPTSSAQGPLNPDILQDELQKKIIENAKIASELSDKVFEISQLKASLEDYQRLITESDNKYKSEVARLKNKNHELQFTLEEIQKERHAGTPNKSLHPTTSQTTSCNGDFLSEGGSLMGSEDALSSVYELNVNEQINNKMHLLEQENQKQKMEYEILRMENESLKLDLARYISASQKRKGDSHDSGDFNHFGETSTDSEGRVTGLLGSLEVPFILSQEVQAREERVKDYFRGQITKLRCEKDTIDSKCELYVKECEWLRLRYEELEQEKKNDEQTIEEKHKTISRLEEELHSTSRNYEEQMSVLTEHVAGLNDQLASRQDQLDLLKLQMSSKKK